MMDLWNEFVAWMETRLQQELPGFEAQKRMMNINRPYVSVTPETARQSGVLILLYPEMQAVNIVLIERSKDGGVHSGQIALPGGKKEDSDPDIVATALREAQEEVSLDPAGVQVIGQLTPLYIPVSNFIVHPVVGVCSREPALLPSEWEVARILKLSLADAFGRKETVHAQASGFPGLTIQTLAYLMSDESYIWGATAMILSELESIWEEWNNRSR
jgi:8-oxo-dGTP pyrophosphatase MutT (NUDIX family)